jgi:hypothetical protein
MHHGGMHAAAGETRRRTLSRKEGNARLGRWGSARAQTGCSVVGHACNAECAALRCTALHCAALRCTARQALHCAARQALHCAAMPNALRCTALRCAALHGKAHASTARAVGLAHAARGAPLVRCHLACVPTRYSVRVREQHAERARWLFLKGMAGQRHGASGPPALGSVRTVDNVMSLAGHATTVQHARFARLYIVRRSRRARGGAVAGEASVVHSALALPCAPHCRTA